MCNSGNRIRSSSTRDSFIMFLSLQGVSPSRTSQSVFTVLSSVSTIPETSKALVFCKSKLLLKPEVVHLQVHANEPFLMHKDFHCATTHFNDRLLISIKCSHSSDLYSGLPRCINSSAMSLQ